jgi:hypothetical protein
MTAHRTTFSFTLCVSSEQVELLLEAASPVVKAMCMASQSTLRQFELTGNKNTQGHKKGVEIAVFTRLRKG